MNINITFTDMGGPPSYLVELLTCKSWVTIAALTSLTWQIREGYSLLSYAMMACDAKKFTSFQRAIPEIHQELQEHRTSWDWWAMRVLQEIPMWLQKYMYIFVYIWNMLLEHILGCRQKMGGVIWIIYDMSLCHIRTPGSSHICCGEHTGWLG